MLVNPDMIFATPGFQSALSQNPDKVNDFMRRALGVLGHSFESQPSMAFGDPTVTEDGLEDETEMKDGSMQFLSARIPASPRQWCKRDDYPHGPVFTFLLPGDY